MACATGKSEAFIQRWINERARPRHQPRQFVFRHISEIAHSGRPRCQPRQGFLARPSAGARDHQIEIAAKTKTAPRIQQRVHVLARLDGPEIQNVRLLAGPRLRAKVNFRHARINHFDSIRDPAPAAAPRPAVSSPRWQSTGRRAPAHSSPGSHRLEYWQRCAVPASAGTSYRKWWPSASRPWVEIGSDSTRGKHPPWAWSSAAAVALARHSRRTRAPGAGTFARIPRSNARDSADPGWRAPASVRIRSFRACCHRF